MRYTCPVCGYPGLAEPPRNYSICPSCGTEFENDDYDRTYAQLRAAWLAKGAPWFSRATPRPVGWTALAQLLKAGLIVVTMGDSDPAAAYDTETTYIKPRRRLSPRIFPNIYAE